MTNWMVSALLSGIIATIVSSILYYLYDKGKEKRMMKFDVLKDIVGYRFAITNDTLSDPTYDETRCCFLSALNQVIVAFNGSKKVIKAYGEAKSNFNNQNLMNLIKEMSKNVGIDYSSLNDFIEEPFIISQNRDNYLQICLKIKIH